VELSLYEQNSLCATAEYAKFGYATAGHMTAEYAKPKYLMAEYAKPKYLMAECAGAYAPIKSQWGGYFHYGARCLYARRLPFVGFLSNTFHDYNWSVLRADLFRFDF
jgi:hypothetical protein